MGGAICLPANKKGDKNIIWIDPNINNDENKEYSKKLKLMNMGSVGLFTKIDESLEYLKKIKFNDTKIIISGRLYSDFIKNFKVNILDMYIAPKIIVFTSNRDRFIENNEDYKDITNIFYTNGGVACEFNEVKVFLEKDSIDIQENETEPIKTNETYDLQLTFEYIDKKEKLMLPLLFKSLIDKTTNKDMENYNKYNKSVFEKYSNQNEKIKTLFGPIKSMRNIPIEILSKYYARLYTSDSDFHKNLNKDLGLKKKVPYIEPIPFIKILYEGVKLKSLPLASQQILFRYSLISVQEINNIEKYIEKKIIGLPSSIVFSRSFMSFSKDIRIAERFKKKNLPPNLCGVLYILEKDDTIGYDLSTHCDIQNISFFPNEKEVLFFPFSAFEIKDIKEKNNLGEKYYEIKLLYLGKYLKEIKNDKNLTTKENKIPDTEYKKQLTELGLIEKTKMEKINTQSLYNSFKLYKKEVNHKDNFIIGEIVINSEDINKNIQIINSFENANLYDSSENQYKFKNEEEIKNNIQIKIEGQKIDFTYLMKFGKEGKYKIKYTFTNSLTNINCLFYGCHTLTNLDLSHFNTKDVTNMNNMFYGCKSLKNLNLSNFNTQKVNDMSRMFYGCESLTDLTLSDFNTKKVIDMSEMFCICKALKTLDLSNFNTESVENMSEMFCGCKALKTLDLSNFNTKNVNKMVKMFYGCQVLKNLDLSNFDTKNTKDMNEMFHWCEKLKNDNVKTKDEKIKELIKK